MNKYGDYHTKKQLLKYVPKGKLEAVSDAWEDEDGMWIILKDGWNADRTDWNCKTIHEDTIAQLKYQISGIRRISNE